MHTKDERPERLGWVQVALRAANPDLPRLRISAQSHYGPPDRIAFVELFGVDSDRARRRQLLADASDILRRLGYTVDLEVGRDAYDVAPVQPTSAHDQMRMPQRLHEASERECCAKLFGIPFVIKETGQYPLRTQKRTPPT